MRMHGLPTSSILKGKTKRVKLTFLIHTTFIHTCVIPDKILAKKSKSQYFVVSNPKRKKSMNVI